VCLGVGLLSGTYDQVFVFYLTIAGFLIRDALFEERMGLQFSRTIVSEPCQSSHSRVQVPQNSLSYFTDLFETPIAWRARSQYFYLPETERPSYTPGHWVVVTTKKFKVILRPTISRPVSPGVKPKLGPLTNYSFSLKLSLDRCGFVILCAPFDKRTAL
jgi:hypothetical protein